MSSAFYPSEPQWLSWAKELQALSQSGLAYSQNAFERERYERIREISAEMLAAYAAEEISLETVKALFCNEDGYQTPKLDSRAVVYDAVADKMLLVKESNGLWSLPGGWVDVDETVGTNTIKEAREEAGVDVRLERLLAVLIRDNRSSNSWIHNIVKIFVLCTELSGQFKPNLETLDAQYFGEDELPEICEDKVTTAQIKLCFQAAKDPHWQPVLV
ncbi:NUDIX hydrolase N-terminal domain-containing protein [Arcanobacterium hippocoleae]|uniref:ADP-ribose pyrophosphatase YjhB (NUDIX family) n=1 Tax=Arcanobacterium hippocoleae TaxID=149017 RepID=A0ABU1T0G5_9ACTO|nr:NUDIX hydrolase N-terminal domain-containing protein [Arcanobacterium hippocoleae]MDR6938847.1 ADP-ribose pyrophosphatase YjhB (NUDIX family) [Arcanobacterium hippocoleae]